MKCDFAEKNLYVTTLSRYSDTDGHDISATSADARVMRNYGKAK